MSRSLNILIIFITIALFIIVPTISFLGLRNRWSCENNQCNNTSAIDSALQNIKDDVNDEDITDTTDKSVVENKYCKRYGYYADDNYYGGYDGNVYLYNSNTYPKYFPKFEKESDTKTE